MPAAAVVRAGINRYGEGEEKLYIEGAVIHGGPESCVGVREGVGDALTGVRLGWVIEPRDQRFGVPTPYNRVEGYIAGRVSASGRPTLRGLRTCACAESPCARTGRPDGRPSVSMMPRRDGIRPSSSPPIRSASMGRGNRVPGNAVARLGVVRAARGASMGPGNRVPGNGPRVRLLSMRSPGLLCERGRDTAHRRRRRDAAQGLRVRLKLSMCRAFGSCERGARALGGPRRSQGLKRLLPARDHRARSAGKASESGAGCDARAVRDR